MSQNELEKAGSQGKPTRYRTLFTNRFFSGLWTQRNPLRDAASPFIYEKFYGSRLDAMIDGANVELTNRLTLQRRPGVSVYNSQLFPAIDAFYSFRQNNNNVETIKVIADGASAVYDATGPNTINPFFTKSAGAGQTSFLGVGNTLFMGDGVDQMKWDGTTLSQWGLSGPTAALLDSVLAYAGAPCRFWSPSTAVQSGYAILDSNGNVQLMTGNQNAAQSFNTTLAPAVTSNGTLPSTLPVTVSGGSGVTRNPFQNPQNAFDGNPNTFAQALFQHTNQVGVCVWGFSYSGATPVSLTLNVLSGANAPLMTGTPMSQGVWYSLDGGNTWTAIWSQTAPNVVPVQWYNVSIPAATNVNNIQVCAYMQSHDNDGEQIYEINLAVGTNTIPIQLQGSKMTGTATPTWNTNLFGLTNDGTAIWQNMGPIQPWQAGHVYSLTGASGAVLDSNGNLQVMQVAGVSGATVPTWATTAGQTTTDGTVTWLNVGPGATVAHQGWEYVYAYHTTSGEVSTASPVSNSTGPVLGTIAVPLSGVGSANSDQVWIFRTADGGATLFFLAAITNPGAGNTWTYLDTNPDANLNEFIQAPINLGNNPPPTGLVSLCFHLGRIWGSVGNTVYYTRAADATAGSTLSSFPPANNIVFPSKVTKLYASGSGLLVFTVSDVYLVQWDGTSTTIIQVVPYLQGTGLLSPNAFDVNGALVYLHTADGQIVSFDPSSGVSEIGFPIGDQITWNPGNTYLTWHVSGSADKAIFVGDGATGWFRCNPTSAPESGLSWSPKATIAGGIKAIQSIEVTPGVKRMLVAPANGGPILQRDLTVFTDNGTPYVAHATIGSIVLAQPGQMAELMFVTLDSTAAGSVATLGVRLDEIGGPFGTLTVSKNDPPQLVASSTLYGNRYYFSQTAQAAWCRHMQLDIQWPAEAFQNELLTYSIYGASWNTE